MTTVLDLLTEPISSTAAYLDLRERIRKELPDVVATHREAMVVERKLPTAVVDKLRSLQVFSIAKPADAGGLGLSSPEQNDIVESISRIDASVGWCVMIGIDSGIYSGYLDDPHDEFFDQPNLVSAGWIHPQGNAVQCGDHIEFTGNWQFGSGIDHADRVMAGVKLYESREDLDNGTDRWQWRILAAHPQDFRILDTWHTTGLEGSGSRHYTTRAATASVPVSRSMSFDNPLGQGPLYTGRDAILRKMSGVPLGIAISAFELALEKAQPKYAELNEDRALLEQRIGDLFSRLYTARAAVHSSLERQWAAANNPTDRDTLHTAVVGAALARQSAFRTARDVVRESYDITGGRAIYKDNKRYSIDQMLRDIETVNQHAVAQDAIVRSTGQLVLSGATANPFLSREEAKK
ncbi:acyl-CoA dehydrogenase family protein [Rhodococcoides yunnanense]|jgi:alkylation response protein AidB-like acyl-CoA dehydrogenase|uniref:acyl-CoA dehydrogenase family protein n=1 Tax=Rhodococcoides yunnanense TaxID=278209 RepID=UPI0022B0FA27|nr:acyl-CoA dehydrogenase family protein [Rhodococcus yunnanensis]MCZ4278508.1 acyl-CoA dehydrogenase family protein [Rhodococcus yunnanensis]